MELRELVAYAEEKYGISEQHKWADFPGFSVLCHPQTDKWVALLMRQWDGETGTEIQRCDLKCGHLSPVERALPYLATAYRMHGLKWFGVRMEDVSDPKTVFRLLDRAIAEGTPHGFTVVLDALPGLKKAIDLRIEKAVDYVKQVFTDTPLPFETGAYQPSREQLPEPLRQLKQMYPYGVESPEARARNFYRQAQFMRDYEDDVPWAGEFVRYFPTYHDLTTRQLRGYFAWRTQARRGNWQPIATSAAYIYVYELLNGVGADGPEDVLQQLRTFEVGYVDSGVGDGRIRNNLHRWMLEYAVLHDLPAQTTRQYADPELLKRDDALAVLKASEEHPDEAVFSALCFFGGKKIQESPVIASDPVRGMRLFSEAWRKASAFRLEEKRLFTLCFGRKKTRRWYPLSNAVYYERSKPQDRDYVLDDCRSYHCKGGVWQETAYDKASFDRARLQGFLHETDARLRRYMRTSRYLKEKPVDAWAIPYIDAVIEADRQAELEAARPKIVIDLSGLEKIRQDAVTTRDSLLTEEEWEETEEVPETAETPTPKAEDPPEDPIQTQILRALLHGEDATGIVKANHLMPSVAADLINEALFDEIGDTVVICENDRLSLVEDYMEDVQRLLGGSDNG